MRHWFLDTNVLLDYVLDRKPHSFCAESLFHLVEGGRLRLSSASFFFVSAHYVARKQPLRRNLGAIAALLELRQFIGLLPVTEVTVDKALVAGFADFEDAVQYFTAQADSTVEAIVTGDRTGFQRSQLPVYTPEQAVQLLLDA